MDGASLLVARSGTACRAPTRENAQSEKNDVAICAKKWRPRCGDALAQARLPVLLKGGQKKCQARGLADYEANGIFLQETIVRCQVIICVEQNNPR